jgi:WD40 repeat protein
LATSGNDQTVRLWNMDAATLTTSVPDRTAACFAPDGKQLALATHTGLIELRDTNAAQVHLRLRGDSDCPDRLCFAADGKRLAACGKDGGLYLWDAARGLLLAELRGYQGRPRCVTLAADGNSVAAGTADGKLLLWDTSSLTKSGELSHASQN